MFWYGITIYGNAWHALSYPLQPLGCRGYGFPNPYPYPVYPHAKPLRVYSLVYTEGPITHVGKYGDLCQIGPANDQVGNRLVDQTGRIRKSSAR